MVNQVVAFSGGKDSTAMVLMMHEAGEDFHLLFTPTGNELPELNEHLSKIVGMTGKQLMLPANHSLDFWIRQYNALPNFRMRWCTRVIKIVPCIEWLQANPGFTLCVGLRFDEDDRIGLYGDYAKYRYPLREQGWSLRDVQHYLAQRGITVPQRTDCALCYGQRIAEWWRLWRFHPDKWAEGEAYEALTGHTFRSSQRDSWPAGLKELRAEFESGRVPRKAEGDAPLACRVCTL